MGDFISYMTSTEFAVDVLPYVNWAAVIVSCSVCVYSVWRLRKSIREGQWITAQEYARLAVFDSWMRTAARTTPWSEELEFNMRQQAANFAREKGEKFYADYLKAENVADLELDAVINKLGANHKYERK